MRGKKQLGLLDKGEQIQWIFDEQVSVSEAELEEGSFKRLALIVVGIC